MLFENKVFTVTGGASGIGAATVRQLAAQGAKLVVADVDDEGSGRLVDEVVKAGGVAASVHVDVSKEADADAMVAFALSTYGRLDGSVNNAGVAQPPMRLHETDEAVWKRLIDINLTGMFHSLRAELRHFLSVGGGTIVNTASGLGLRAGEYQGTYSATKHAVIGLTRTAAIEYIGDGIRVNAVAPGLVKTPMLAGVGPEQMAAFAALQPGGRVAEANEVSNAIVWLLSEESSFVSGEALVVDAALSQKS
ncbi:SDR family oxidoreductase [Rhodococcus sp. (in: high G+C Gram-positive bacteria)]|jgi:NAD(P)-dependent dehydrogenase (short-subunit alcohol dehydrogenase family)|uniref:SDR family NAD(P)-dependent oxidoreductase n=1 Tax=Rhodococcus sp. TaxID=1831 RepID=UPI00257F2884|nr:SDR family oxidoreductase [Rhodococcus sp. (in: high G+C Gram-positive bacteria)]MBQ7806099.1 SDR family oxidoreductase [Rhodococcus sp. (in: high G+C Gram-positive bacteria)]